MKKKTLTLLAIGGILLIGSHEIRLYAQSIPAKPAPAPVVPSDVPKSLEPTAPVTPAKPGDPAEGGASEKPVDPSQPKPVAPSQPEPPADPAKPPVPTDPSLVPK